MYLWRSAKRSTLNGVKFIQVYTEHFIKYNIQSAFMCFQKVRIDNLDTIISHSTTMHFCTVPLYEDGICLNISYINGSKTKDDALS